MTYSFRRPLEGLSWLQLLIWPLIFAQLVALKRWVRARYGRGVPYRVSIGPFGQVDLLRMPMDAVNGYAAPAAFAEPHAAFSLGPARASFHLACAPACAPPPPPPEAAIRAVMTWAPPPAASPDSS